MVVAGRHADCAMGQYIRMGPTLITGSSLRQAARPPEMSLNTSSFYEWELRS